MTATATPDVFGQIDWWNPRHSLLQNVGFKLDWFHEKIGTLFGWPVTAVEGRP